MISIIPLKKKIFMKLDVFSDTGFIDCGIPQGSILMPLLFHLPHALNETGLYVCIIILGYNICIFYQDKYVEYVGEIKKVLNKEFSSLCEWSTDNKLSVHVRDDKTKKLLPLERKAPQN